MYEDCVVPSLSIKQSIRKNVEKILDTLNI